MTKTFFVLLFLFLAIELQAEQPAWELLTMTPPRGEVSSLDFDGNILCLSSYNLFLSTNLGNDWICCSYDNSWGGVIHNNIIFTTKKNYQKSGLITWGVYKSENFGKSWIECTGNWDNNWPASQIIKDSNRVIACISKNRNKEIFITDNEGLSWTLQGELSDDGEIDHYVNLTVCKNIMTIFGNSKIKGSNIYLSIDTGKTWEKIYFETSQIYNIYINSANDIYLTTRNGVWFSGDTCKNWELKYLNGDYVYSVVISEDKKKIIANLLYKGLVYSTDSGKVWNSVDEFNLLKQNGLIISSAIFSYNRFCFICPSYLGVFRSSNFGQTWEEKNDGFSSMNPFDFTINPNNEMYISHFGVFKSENKGKNFTFRGMRDYCFQSLAYNNKGYIFAGTGYYNGLGAYMYRSKDGGNTWDSTYVSNTSIGGIVIDKDDNIFVASAGSVLRSKDDGVTWTYCSVECGKIGINDEGHIFSFSSGHIFSSTDQGETWREIASQQVDPTYIERDGRVIFNKKTKTAAYGSLMTTNNGRRWFPTVASDCNFQTTESKYFAVDSLGCWISTNVWNSKIANYDYGLFRSCDNGITWTKMDTTGLKHREYGPIEISPDGHIYVFGSTGGLYRSRDAYVSVKEEEPKEQIFVKNYPNPATVQTLIELNLKQPGELKLTVFDGLGKLQETKTYGWQDSGELTIILDTEKYPAGVYNCHIQYGEYKEAVKINVVK